jgi:hypothetical protein
MPVHLVKSPTHLIFAKARLWNAYKLFPKVYKIQPTRGSHHEAGHESACSSNSSSISRWMILRRLWLEGR